MTSVNDCVTERTIEDPNSIHVKNDTFHQTNFTLVHVKPQVFQWRGDLLYLMTTLLSAD